MNEALDARPFMVVAYYTDSYAYLAADFADSCIDLNIPFKLERVNDLGSWRANTHYKPTFIRQCLDEVKFDIVYVDVDARFVKYPELFHTIDCDISFHRLRGEEVLSGTIYFKNNEVSKNVCNRWIERCSIRQDVWEQTKLEGCLEGAVVKELPIEYCAIFDHPLVKLENAVIVHYQASRKHRKD